MTDLPSNPSYLQIHDRLAAIGRKYRARQVLAGVLRWTTWAISASVVAALAAHFLHEGLAAIALAMLWLIWLAASAALWIARPLFHHPSDIEVARIVESRIDGLNNGLTNSILLARAPDLHASPFLFPIFDEVHRLTSQKPLDQAVSLSDLKPAAKKFAAVAFPALILAIAFRDPLSHGWRQMLSPSEFVPQTGSVQITQVLPGNITLVAGLPLEIEALAKDSANPAAAPDGKLIFDGPSAPVSLTGSSADDNQFRYSYRIDHVDQSLRYRLEIGSTQSAWFNVNVVPQLKLTAMDFRIQPPAYTHLPPTTLTLASDQFGKQPITVPQGSLVSITATIDAPATSATLQLGDSHSSPMSADPDHQHFSQTATILADTPIRISLMQGQQIVAKTPANPLLIHCQIDSPPQIEMKWPVSESTIVSPASDLEIQANLHDDWGIAAARVLLSVGDAPPTAAYVAPQINQPLYQLKAPIHLSPGQITPGQSIHVQVEATDNRDLTQEMKAAGVTTDTGGPQTSRGPLIEIQFADPSQASQLREQSIDKLRARLTQMLTAQQSLQDRAAAAGADKDAAAKILTGQTDLKNLMQDTAANFQFDDQSRFIKRTLQVLAVNSAKDAVDVCSAILTEPLEQSRSHLNHQLRATQQHIITTLESLLAMLTPAGPQANQPSNTSDPLSNHPDLARKLDDALKQYMKQQQKIMNQSAPLAKKSVDDYTADDKKLLADLRMSQENLDAFVQRAISDFSKNGPQDMTNSDLTKDLLAMQSEVTLAKNAMAAPQVETAVAAEDTGVSDALQASKDLEKWLSNSPDRNQMTQEDLTSNAKMPPTPPLPKNLEDMVGKLMEQEEDLLQSVQDANANMQMPNMQQGWNAGEGPIADNSGKAVTGNQLPKQNQEPGRAAEGRNGQSQGQFIGDSAVGKGGRDTPTRLDPTPFEKGQINDTSHDAVGGATGGGKISGQGGQGLEGPLPAQVQQQLQRLAQRQAELRNAAQKLNLKYRLARYDNFKLEQSIEEMAAVESDLKANRYQNALLHRDVLLDSLASSKMLLGGQLHVQLDTTPAPTGKTQLDINDAMTGELPPAWAKPLKEYYEKLSQQ